MIAENIQFTEPRLCDCGGDITKQWYVYFNCTDLVRKETKQFRYKLGINCIKEIRQRKKVAKEAVDAIKDLLYNDGFNPFEKSYDCYPRRIFEDRKAGLCNNTKIPGNRYA